MNPSIDLRDWYSALQDALWWGKDLHPDYAILLYQYTKQAYEQNLTYCLKDPIGQDVNLTKIYEQFKLLATLRAEYK